VDSVDWHDIGPHGIWDVIHRIGTGKNAMPRPLSVRKRRAFALALAILVVAVVEGLSAIALLLAPRVLDAPIRRKSSIFQDQSHQVRLLLAANATRREEIDSVLGWRTRAGFRRGGDVINSQGLRSNREYSPQPARDVVRVAAFGDSFVYGNEVDTKAAWTSVVEREFPQFEVLNYGVSGYGFDQAYLRFLDEGMRFSPEVVIMGFVADDLGRLVNTYRRFISEDEPPLFKPRFVFDSRDSLVLLPTPVPKPVSYEQLLRNPEWVRGLRSQDQWFEPVVYDNPLYDVSATVRLASALWVRLDNRFLDKNRLLRGGVFSTSSEAFGLQVALFQRFADDVSRAKALPLVIVFPDRTSLRAARAGRPRLFAPLVTELQRRGIDHADLTHAFLERDVPGDIDQWFMPVGHYSRLGNEIVGRAIGRAVSQRLTHRGTAQVP
jgi:hypothetical protein